MTPLERIQSMQPYHNSYEGTPAHKNEDSACALSSFFMQILDTQAKPRAIGQAAKTNIPLITDRIR